MRLEDDPEIWKDSKFKKYTNKTKKCYYKRVPKEEKYNHYFRLKGRDGAKLTFDELLAFAQAEAEFEYHKINGREFAKRCGVSYPTLCKYFEIWYSQLNEAIATGQIIATPIYKEDVEKKDN